MKVSKIRNSISILLVITLIMTLIPIHFSYGAVKTSVKSPVLVSEFETGVSNDYVKITAEGSTVTMNYESALPGVKYRLALRKVETSTVTPRKVDFYANSSFTQALDISGVANGTYYLVLSKAANDEQAIGYEYIGGKRGYTFIGMPIKITNGNAKIAIYKDVVDNNNKIRKANEKKGTKNYKSKSLSDLTSLLYRDPKTKKISKGASTSGLIKYYKKVSDQVVKGAENNYEKLHLIYEYVASNFYYDTVAFRDGKNQYVNPYKNLVALRNKKTGPNSYKGKVATTCVGYGAIVMALGRAQGIPVKMAYGHALTSPWNTWGTEKNIKVLDHWWPEAYVDGEWIVIDPTRGTNAKWDSSKGSRGWDRRVEGQLTNNYFDPSDEFLSNTHLYQGIR